MFIGFFGSKTPLKVTMAQDVRKKMTIFRMETKRYVKYLVLLTIESFTDHIHLIKKGCFDFEFAKKN